MISKNYTKKKLITFVCSLYEQHYPYTQIAKLLNDNNIPTVSARMKFGATREYIGPKQWYRETITDIVTNKEYNPTQRKYSASDIIKALNKVHNHQYTYPSLTSYKGSDEKIEVICPKHGAFYPTINTHLNGSKCKRCIQESNPNTILERMKAKHNGFYSEYDMEGYSNTDSSIKIKCPTHGWFTMRAGYHALGGRCLKCITDEQHVPINVIRQRAFEVHNFRYKEYDFSDYTNARSKLKVKCPIHGWFSQNVRSHLRGCGCPKCKMSKGEREIMKFIDSHEWIYQHSFEDCLYMNERKLWFDFYSPSHKIAIEYQGYQHYHPVDAYGGKEGFIQRQLRDKFKESYCKLNGIKLIQISYKSFSKIEEILRQNGIRKDSFKENLGVDFM